MTEKNLNKKHSALINEIIEFIADPAVMINSAGQVLFANLITEKYTGIPVEDLLGKSFFDQHFFDEIQTLLIKEKMKKRLDGVEIEPYEISLKNKQNETILLEVNAKRVKHCGQVLDFIVFRDVTKRSRKQKELQYNLSNTELKFRTISDSIFDAVVLFDEQEKIRYWNAAAQRIYGYRQDEIMGKTLKETIVPPQAFDLLTKVREKFIKEQGVIKKAIEFPGLRKGNFEFPSEVTLSKINVGNEELIVAAVRDISERKNYEYTLKQQHDLLEAVTKNTGVGLTIITRNYQILWSNKQLKEIFGSDIENKTCYRKLHNQMAICLDCGVKKIFDGAVCDIKEAEGIAKDGKSFVLQVTTTPILDKNGEVAAALEITVPVTHRKQMEIKIKEAEKLHRALFEQTPVGVLVVDPDNAAVLEFNDVSHRQLGYSREEFSKLHMWDFEALVKPQEILEQLGSVLKVGKNEFLTKHRTKNNEIRLVVVNQCKIELSGREVILATCHDVTSINRMYDELQSAEEKFRGITNSIKDALILIDEHAKVTYWNPAAEKTFGYTKKEVIGRKIHDLVVPQSMCREGRVRIEESMKIFSETGMGYFTVGKVELVGRRKDGSEFPAELSVSSLNANGSWKAVGIVKDITERKIADQKLRDAEQRYHALFNQAPLGVLVIDPETNECIEFNDCAHQQLGYTREEFEKIPIYEIEAKKSLEEIKAHTKQMIESGGEEFQTQHRTKNGEIRNVIVTTRTFQTAGKKYLYVIFHDITEIKKVQNALIASESRYRQLVELAHEGIWAINNDFKVVFVNPRMTQMLGYTGSEMRGKQIIDFFNAEEREKNKAILEEYKASGGTGQFEFKFSKKDGQRVDAIIALSTITDDQKQKIGMLAVISDITERKRAEQALAESEERFRAISTSAMDAIVLSDMDDKVIYWNPGAEKIFGFLAEEVLGKKITELIIPLKAQNKYIQTRKELNNKPTSKRELGISALRKNGSAFPIDLSVITVRLKDKNCLLLIVRDITESKALEEALRQERDLLESVATSTNIVLAIINHDYKVIWANETAKQVVHCNKIENRACYETLGNGSKGVCEGCGVKKVFEEGKNIVRRDYKIKTSERDVWSELITTPIKDKDGSIIAALEIAIDITERKHLQNKLAEYSQKLEELVQKRTEQLKKTQAELVKSERLAAIGELAGMVGHDLRNPLTGIKNSAYFLKKKGTKLPLKQTQEMLEIIDKCVDYSNKIVSDLLDYSREIHLELVEDSPKNLLSEALKFIIIPKKVKIKNKLPETPLLNVDPDKIKRVFINLVKNAIEVMPSGGNLTVDSLEVKGSMEISFHDTGSGISDEVLPKLFAPLYTTKAQGMGFGLAICKRIIEAHGGTITVSTIKNYGTTFTVTLPFKPKFEIGGEKVWIKIPESSLSTTMKP